MGETIARRDVSGKRPGEVVWAFWLGRTGCDAVVGFRGRLHSQLRTSRSRCRHHCIPAALWAHWTAGAGPAATGEGSCCSLGAVDGGRRLPRGRQQKDRLQGSVLSGPSEVRSNEYAVPSP